MNNAKLEKSKRLQAVYRILKSGKPYSTMQLIKRSGMCAISAIISELRCCGFDIACKRRGNSWYYKLV